MTSDQWASDGFTVWPLDDIQQHDLDNPDCSCGTFFEGHILVHNAFDGREQYERGERKVS
jgi:hypothetical protein